MKKTTFTAALAQETASDTAEQHPTRTKPKDDRINTTLRISPEGLEALKVVAAAKRTRVNDLLLEGAEYVLALHGKKMDLRTIKRKKDAMA